MRLIGLVLVLVVLAVSQSNGHGVKGYQNSENSWSHSYSSASASASSFSSSYSSGTGPKNFPHPPSATAFASASAQANANAGGGSANAGAIAGAQAGETPAGYGPGIGSGSEIYKGSSANSGALAGAQVGGYRPGGGVGSEIYKGSSINSGALAGAQVGGYRPGGDIGSETYKGSSVNSDALAGAQAGGYRPGEGAGSDIYKESTINSDSIVGPQIGGSSAGYGPDVGAAPEIYKGSSINAGALAGAQAGGSSAGYGPGAGSGPEIYKGSSVNSGPIVGPQAGGSSAGYGQGAGAGSGIYKGSSGPISGPQVGDSFAGYGPGAGSGTEISKESTVNSDAIAAAQAGGSSAGYGSGVGPAPDKISGTESGFGSGLGINGGAADKGTDGNKGGDYGGNLATVGADSKVDAGIGTFGSIGFGAGTLSGNRASGSQDNTFTNNVIPSDGSLENNDKDNGKYKPEKIAVSGSFNLLPSTVNDFGAGSGPTGPSKTGSDTSLGCCKGPFPGPKGSIHDYKPAPPGGGGPDPAWLTSGTGANAVSNSGYSIGGSYNTRPESSGLTYNLVNSLPGASGSIYTSKPAIDYPKQPSYSGIGTTEVHNVISTFPGPAGGISHSKPAASDSSSYAIANSNTQSVIGTLPGPTDSIYASKPATSVSSSSSTLGPSGTGIGGPSIVGTLPGPAGSIHDSKPAGGVSFGGGSSSGIYNQGTSSGGNVVISNLPGPSGSIYEHKPVVPSTTDYVSGHGSEGAGINSFSSEGAFGTDVPSKPISQVIPTLPGRPGSIYESKPIAAIGCSGTSCHKPVVAIAVTPERFPLKPISSSYSSGTGCIGSSCGFPQPPVYKPTTVIVEQVPLIPVHSKPIVGCSDGSCGGYKPVVGCSGGSCGNNKPVVVGCIGGSCDGYKPAVDIPLVRDKTTYFSSEGCYGTSCKQDVSPQKPNYELLPPAFGPDCNGKDKNKSECSGLNGGFAPSGTERGSTSTDIAGNALKPAVSSGPTVQAVNKDSSTESGGYGGSLAAPAISADYKPGSKPISSISGFDSYANAEASASAQSEAGSQSGHYSGIIGPAVPSVNSQTNIQTDQSSSTDLGSGSDCKNGAPGCSISNKNTAPYTSSYEITKPGTGDLPVISDASADSYKEGSISENKDSTLGIGASNPSNKPVSIGGSSASYGSSNAGSHGFINKPATGCNGGSCNYPDRINVLDNISKGPGVSNFGTNYFGHSNSGSLSGANYPCLSGSCGGLSPASKPDAHASYGDKDSKPHSVTSSGARVPISACIGNTCAPLSPQVGAGAISGSYSGSGSYPHGSDNGYAIGGVLIHKADGSVSSGKDNLGSYGSGGIKGSGSGCLGGSCGSLGGSKASSGSYSGSYSSGGGAGSFGFGGGFGGNLGFLGGVKGGSSALASASSSNPHDGVGPLGHFFKGGIDGAFSKAGAFSGAGSYSNSGAIAKSGAYSSSFASAISKAEAGSH